MRLVVNKYGTKLWLSAADTYAWARREGACWPGSQLSGSRLFAEFAPNGDLIDIAIDGHSEQDCDSNELNAIVSDHIRPKHPNHPAIR